jgi:DNA-binding MarR family transcriptional regulator
MPAGKLQQKPPAVARPSESALRELIRCLGLLDRVMQPYFSRFGISGAQWAVLRNLHRAEEEGLSGLRLTDLGERLLIRPPSVTGVVDRLEKAGLVMRDGLPTDHRSKQVALTSLGRDTVARVLAGHSDQVDKVVGGLTRREQEELRRLLRKLGGHLTRMADNGSFQGLPVGKAV